MVQCSSSAHHSLRTSTLLECACCSLCPSQTPHPSSIQQWIPGTPTTTPRGENQLLLMMIGTHGRLGLQKVEGKCKILRLSLLGDEGEEREEGKGENASQLGESTTTRALFYHLGRVQVKKVEKGKKMFLKVQLPWNVIIPAENLDAKGLMLQRSIVVCLLADFAKKRATKDLGYYLAVSTLESIGEGKVRQHTGDVLFPVVFSGITFKICKGEILEGVVHKVLKHGVLLRCGPIENIYLSSMKMLDYRYVPGENPVFLNDKTSKIEKDVVVRFVVLGTKWLEAEREFQALVSLEGDYLGPVS